MQEGHTHTHTHSRLELSSQRTNHTCSSCGSSPVRRRLKQAATEEKSLNLLRGWSPSRFSADWEFQSRKGSKLPGDCSKDLTCKSGGMQTSSRERSYILLRSREWASGSTGGSSQVEFCQHPSAKFW